MSVDRTIIVVVIVAGVDMCKYVCPPVLADMQLSYYHIQGVMYS